MKGKIIMTNNNNIADISVFESLQSDQHTKTGVSQMAVFNEIKPSDVSAIVREL
jgi:hypothetical protein